MREIKFRAWDGKKFGYVHVGPSSLIWPAPDYFEQVFSGKREGSPEQVRFPKVADWQQYTGLEDKNGNEIYEGDVVIYIRHDRPIRATVEWDNGCYYLRNHKDHVDSDTMNKDSMFFIGAERMEVIGNIYENPDLIK